MLPERLLQRVQLAAVGEALDGRDLGAVGLDGEHQARAHAARRRRRTVQAPHTPCSQPRFVPVSPRSSRRKSESSRARLDRDVAAAPLTVSWMAGRPRPSCLPPPGLAARSARWSSDAGEPPAVAAEGVHVGARLRDRVAGAAPPPRRPRRGRRAPRSAAGGSTRAPARRRRSRAPRAAPRPPVHRRASSWPADRGHAPAAARAGTSRKALPAPSGGAGSAPRRAARPVRGVVSPRKSSPPATSARRAAARRSWPSRATARPEGRQPGRRERGCRRRCPGCGPRDAPPGRRRRAGGGSAAPRRDRATGASARTSAPATRWPFASS